jgi:hypothetical protein
LIGGNIDLDLLSLPSKICKNHGKNWERGKLFKVNNGGRERGKRLSKEGEGDWYLYPLP